MKTIISDKKTAELAVADRLRALLAKKPDALIALPGGRSVSGLFAALADMYRAGEISFARARIFAVAEYVDAPEELSHRKTIFDDFLAHTDLPPENFHVPAPDAAEEYEALIGTSGGIDMAVLGIGENAHIGYNEPGTQFLSVTHKQKLTDATKRQNALIFGDVDKVPSYAVTMGIKTITQARDIIVLAFGDNKAEAVHKMLYGRNDSVVPAAFLQIPMNVSVYLDNAASSQV